MLDSCFDRGGGDFQHRNGPLRQPLSGKGAVARFREFLKDELDTRTRPQVRVPPDAEAGGDLVRGLEPDTPDVPCEAVRVVLHLPDGDISVRLVNAEGSGGPDAV